jgi:hypothetical protein
MNSILRGILIILAIAAAVGGLVWAVASTESESTNKPLYESWCRMTHRTDLSLHDWNELRKHNLLPGQSSHSYNEAER